MNNVIIVAGGLGLRMGGDLPKQFVSIGSKPILMHTIDLFHRYDKDIRIILVLHESYRELWANLCQEHGFAIEHETVSGGTTRFDSVKNGLKLVTEGLVAVHDAVRPFASLQLVQKCFEMAKQYKAVIPVIELVDSIREIIDNENSKIVDRTRFRLVQTPQVFDAVLLKKVYEQPFRESFTDDASIIESKGGQVHLVEGERTNIKITTPFDLSLARTILDSF